jgi:hypothetical protein
MVSRHRNRVAATVVGAIDHDAGGAAAGSHLAKGDLHRAGVVTFHAGEERLRSAVTASRYTSFRFKCTLKCYDLNAADMACTQVSRTAFANTPSVRNCA